MNNVVIMLTLTLLVLPHKASLHDKHNKQKCLLNFLFIMYSTVQLPINTMLRDEKGTVYTVKK